MSEPFAFRHLNRLVGAFVITSAVVILAGVVLVGRARHWLAKEFTVTVAFDRNNLGLLRAGLPVKIQGTDAGEVVGATQDAHHTIARLALREDFRAQLRSDAKAIIHTPIAGFLGETFIEVWPGQEEAPFDVVGGLITQLPGDDLLQQTRATITNVGDAAAQVRDLVADNRKSVVATVDAVRATAEAVARLVVDNRDAVNAALTRMEALSRQMTELIAENRVAVKATVDALPATVAAVQQTTTDVGATARKAGVAADAAASTAAAITDAAREATTLVRDNRDDLALAMTDLRTLLTEAEGIASDMKVVTTQVAAGKGSLGKFVMSDDAHDQAVRLTSNANATLDDLRPLIGTVTSVKLFIGAQGGGNLTSGSTTSSAYLRLEPNSSKFYQGGLSYRSAPRSIDPSVQTSDGFPLDVDLLLGWRFFPHEHGSYASLGVGVLESRLGAIVGSQLADRLGLEVLGRGKHTNREATDRRSEDGRFLLRATVNVRVAWRVFAIAGADDLIDHPGWWLGGRIELLDNDLRNLTTFGPLFR